MRIAIVGAGIAGLACAHELERLGVVCDVFEKRDRIGKMFRTVETMLQPLSMEPHRDIFTLLRGECQLPVNPANHIVRTVMHTRNREATLNGGLGYTTIRGYEERSLEMQLHRHITAEVQFDQDVDVRALMKSYDWVVLAAGSPAWPKQFGLWTKDICWWVAGANVKGDFNPAE
ncbi:MAG TPA: FAD-dependent oxidoreductase, partial [Symbiobacteriaceae bacterium]|nr:FAD-dependent oxidoreductase [Symbiobacteriaceae bacterium]